MDKHNRDHKKSKKDDRKPINKKRQFKSENGSDKKAESKKT